MDYSFHLYNSLSTSGLTLSLKKMLDNKPLPVVLCVGSDLSVGDSLGPMVGTRLKEKLKNLNCFVYGTLSHPITAHEVKYCNDFLRQTHPKTPVIAVDAAVGNAGDIALIKINGTGLRPGSGANKRLGRVGDVSIMGIVAEKSLMNYSLFSSTRLNIVYRMAEVIAEGIAQYFIESLST